MLGHLPKKSPSSNFTHMVKQSLPHVGNASRASRADWSWLGRLFGPLSALALACLVALVVIQKQDRAAAPSGEMPELLQLAENTTREPIEVAHLAQNYELIKDLDVIEHLDEL